MFRNLDDCWHCNKENIELVKYNEEIVKENQLLKKKLARKHPYVLLICTVIIPGIVVGVKINWKGGVVITGLLILVLLFLLTINWYNQQDKQ